jgi:putative sporulation protein YtaF
MILLLGIVVSLDGFAAALAYGVQRIRISSLAVLVISLTSASVIFVSMTIGGLLSSLLSPNVASSIGAAILVVLGCYLLYQHSRTEAGEATAAAPTVPDGPEPPTRTVVEINLRMFGLVIQILRQPTLADRDHSGVISWQVAILLGVALALDAFGAGIGAAMTGLPAMLTAGVVGATKIIALASGWELGYRMQHKLNRRLVRLPGLLLIFLGLLDFLMK